MAATKETGTYNPREPRILFFGDISFDDLLQMTGGEVVRDGDGKPEKLILVGARILLKGSPAELAMGFTPGPYIAFDDPGKEGMPLSARGVVARYDSFSIPNQVTVEDGRERVTGITYFKNKGFQSFTGTAGMLKEAAKLTKA